MVEKKKKKKMESLRIGKSHLFVLNRRTRLWKYYGLIRPSERAYSLSKAPLCTQLVSP